MYNEEDHPREAHSGRWRKANNGGKPGALPADDTGIQQTIAETEQRLASGGSLDSEDIMFLSRQADNEDLQALYDAKQPEFDWRICQNPNLPEDKLDELIFRQKDEQWERRIRSGICLRQNMSPQLMDWCESWVRRDSQLPANTRKACAINLVQNRNMRPETINRMLQQYPSEQVAHYAIMNPACNDYTLSLAVEHIHGTSYSHLDQAMRNPSCGPSTLHTILNKKPYDSYREQTVFAHPALDEETLHDWRNHCSPNNDAAAKGAARNPNIDSRMAEDLYATGHVDTQLARNPRTPTRIMDELERKNSTDIDLQLAYNEGLDKQRAQRLFDRNHDNDMICLAISDNQNLPEPLRQQANVAYKRRHAIR